MIKGKQKGKTEDLYPSISMTSDMLELARERANKIPENIKNSILKGKGRLCGAVGEQAFIKLSGGTSSSGRGLYNFDVVLPSGSLCEVKTKERTVVPLPNYACSVANFNATQECDYYVFASTLPEYNKVWILGYLSRDDFKEKAIFRKAGEYDHENGQTCTADCWNVRISQLNNIKELL